MKERNRSTQQVDMKHLARRERSPVTKHLAAAQRHAVVMYMPTSYDSAYPDSVKGWIAILMTMLTFHMESAFRGDLRSSGTCFDVV